MRLKTKIATIGDILKLRLFYKRTPIAIRWQITYRCPLRCLYCNIWKIKLPELQTNEVLSLLNEVARCGTKKISFSGGEPMLRKDIGIVIDHCISKSISAEMNSTGFLIPQKINLIKGLDLLKLSLDGPEEIHDMIRGRKGAYRLVMEAAEAAATNRIKFIFTTTLSKFNIRYVEYMLDLAERYTTFVAFQPLKEIGFKYNSGEFKNLYPSEIEYKNALDILITNKKNGKAHMRNSIHGLHHIYNWPRYGKLRCRAGQIFCMIAPNGDLYPCDRLEYKDPLPNCINSGFKRAFNNSPKIHCNGCGFCGSLELNYLASFNWRILPTLKLILDK